MQGKDALLLQALHRDELRVGSGRGGADRRGVSRVVLLAPLDERLDRLGRDQLHFKAETAQDTSPVMGCTAGLHHHRAARLLLEEGNQFVTPQLALELDFASRINAVELKGGLGCVDANHALLPRYRRTVRPAGGGQSGAWDRWSGSGAG